MPFHWEHWCNINPTLIHPEPKQSRHLLQQHRFLIASHCISCYVPPMHLNSLYITWRQSCVMTEMIFGHCGQFLDHHEMILKWILVLNIQIWLSFYTFFLVVLVLYYNAKHYKIKSGIHWINDVHIHLRELTSFRCGVLCSRRPQEQTQQHPCQRHVALHHNGNELALPKQIITQMLRVLESTIYPLQPGGAHSQSVNHSQRHNLYAFFYFASPLSSSLSMVNQSVTGDAGS